MPSTASRSEVERLHRLMIEASIELAQLDARVEAARAADRLWPQLHVWVAAAEALDEAVQRARTGLLDGGVSKESFDGLLANLGSLEDRCEQFDLELDLDDCAEAWAAVRHEIAALHGSAAPELLRLMRDLEPDMDAATQSLFDARRTGFLARQHRVVAELEKERDRARKRFEWLLQAWLDALRALEETEAAAVVVVPPEEPEEEEKPPQPEAEEQEPRLAIPLPVVELPPPPELQVPQVAEPAEEQPRAEEMLPLSPPEAELVRSPQPEEEREPPAQMKPAPQEEEPEAPEPDGEELIDLPPPPRFVKAREQKVEEKRAAMRAVAEAPALPPPPKPVVAKPAPLPSPPKPVFAKPAPLPPAPIPKRAATKLAPVAPRRAPGAAPKRPAAVSAGVAVERVDRVGAFPPGPDGIGRGSRTATIWFRASAGDPTIAVQGTIGIALGCATRLYLMPSLQIFSAPAGRPVRGKLSLLVVSSGGHLAGIPPRKARDTARIAALGAAPQVAARLGTIGAALRSAIREVLDDAAAEVFARALPGADAGTLPLERALSSRRRRRKALAAHLKNVLASTEAGRMGRLLTAVQPPVDRAEHAESIARDPLEPVPTHGVDQRTGRGAAREWLELPDDQEIDGAAADTWIGSGEGVKIFSDVFGAFLPAVASDARRNETRDADRNRGFFAHTFADLERFADDVGSWAKKRSRLLGKGMHYAESAMHRLGQVDSIAGRVEGFASKTEGILDELGLDRLAEAAGKVAGATEWLHEKADVVHGDLKMADRWMGEGKATADEVRRDARAAAGIFRAAAHGRFGEIVDSLFGGADVDATPKRGVPGAVLDEPRRLDLATLSRMEQDLGDDFSGVRVHTGPAAAEVTRRFAAEAVTVRDHVFFAPGRFNPATAEGQKLIAHELTHVLQKGRRNLDARTAESEALHAESAYAHAPPMETLMLRRPEPDFRLAAEGESTASPTATRTAKRARSRGQETGAKDDAPDGEELLEQVAGRVYELLMNDLQEAFETR